MRIALVALVLAGSLGAQAAVPASDDEAQIRAIVRAAGDGLERR